MIDKLRKKANDFNEKRKHSNYKRTISTYIIRNIETKKRNKLFKEQIIK